MEVMFIMIGMVYFLIVTVHAFPTRLRSNAIPVLMAQNENSRRKIRAQSYRGNLAGPNLAPDHRQEIEIVN